MVSKWTSELYNFEDKYFQGSVNPQNILFS